MDSCAFALVYVLLLICNISSGYTDEETIKNNLKTPNVENLKTSSKKVKLPELYGTHVHSEVTANGPLALQRNSALKFYRTYRKSNSFKYLHENLRKFEFRINTDIELRPEHTTKFGKNQFKIEDETKIDRGGLPSGRENIRNLHLTDDIENAEKEKPTMPSNRRHRRNISSLQNLHIDSLEKVYEVLNKVFGMASANDTDENNLPKLTVDAEAICISTMYLYYTTRGQAVQGEFVKLKDR